MGLVKTDDQSRTILKMPDRPSTTIEKFVERDGLVFVPAIRINTSSGAT